MPLNTSHDFLEASVPAMPRRSPRAVRSDRPIPAPRCLRAAPLLAIAMLAPAAVHAQLGVRFDGSDDHIAFGRAPRMGTTTFTLETWFMRTGAGASTSTGSGGVADAIPIIAKGRDEAEGRASDMNYFLGIRASDNVLIADYEEGARQMSPGLNHPVAGVTPIRSNVWYHAAATFDGRTWRLFLNGNPEATLVVGAGRLPQSASIQHASMATAMSSTGVPAGFFQGVLDEARVWAHARPGRGIRDSMTLEIATAPGLIGRWGLNDGIGCSAANCAGGPAGTLANGPSWVMGSPFDLNDALSFSGTNGYVTFGAEPALGLRQFTIETWFRRDGAGVTTSTGTGGIGDAIPLLTKGRGEAEGSAADMNYFLGIRASDNVLCADFEEGTGGAFPGLNHPIIGVTPIATGAWHHAAATYDGNIWLLYLDGDLEATVVVGQPPQSASIQHAGLATAMTSNGVAGGFFHGVLDEARVWGIARTQVQIQSTINTQLTLAQPGLVARWSLDEGAGTTALGGAGTTVNGTITGPTTAWAWTDPAPFNLVVGPPNAPGGLGAIPEP